MGNMSVNTFEANNTQLSVEGIELIEETLLNNISGAAPHSYAGQMAYSQCAG